MWRRRSRGPSMCAGSSTAIGGAIVANELARLETIEFRADWAAAHTVHGDHTRVEHLARRPGQRRADALVVMARRSAAMTSDHVPARPLISVVVDWPTFKGPMCELEDGTVITPVQIRELLTEAEIERIVFDPARPPHRRRRETPLLHRRPPAGHRGPRPALHPPRLPRAGVTMRDRPHRAVGPRWRDDHRQRPAPLSRPQPPTQPPTTRTGGRTGALSRGAWARLRSTRPVQRDGSALPRRAPATGGHVLDPADGIAMDGILRS